MNDALNGFQHLNVVALNLGKSAYSYDNKSSGLAMETWTLHANKYFFP
jgi:hypothetical protein